MTMDDMYLYVECFIKEYIRPLIGMSSTWPTLQLPLLHDEIDDY